MCDRMSIFDNDLVPKSGVPRHINGISCEAKGCIWHADDNFCTASQVSIGSLTAKCSSETRCATFRPIGEPYGD